MSVWHLSPDYILDNWTEDQLILYIMKYNERRRREDSPEEERPINYEAAARDRFSAFQKSFNANQNRNQH